MNPKSLANLKQFRKGDKHTIACAKKSKRRPLDIQWREKLELYDNTKKKTMLDDIFHILISEAKDGNTKAIDILLDRTFGKSRQTIDVSTTKNIDIVISEMEKTFKNAK